MWEDSERLTVALAAVLTIALLSDATAIAAVAPGVYTGSTPRANRYMDITIQVLRGGGSAN